MGNLHEKHPSKAAKIKAVASLLAKF